MRNSRSAETLEISELDKEIQGLVEADPSAEFVALVRQRVEHEKHLPAWWPDRAFVLVGVVMAVLAMAIVAYRPAELSIPATTVPMAAAEMQPIPRFEPDAMQALLEPLAKPPVARPTALESSPAVPDGMDALRSLLNAAREGRVDLSSLGEPPAELQPIQDVVIEPLVAMEPIRIDALTLQREEEGVRQ